MSSNPRWCIPLGIVLLGSACHPSSPEAPESTEQELAQDSSNGCGVPLADDVLFQFGTEQDDRAVALGRDDAGNLYLAGNTSGALGEPGEQGGGQDVFLAKLSSSLQFQWAHQFGAADDDTAWDVAVTSQGSLPGQFSSGGTDLFVARYDNAGQRSWLSQQGTREEDYAISAALRPGGRLGVTGATMEQPMNGFDVVLYEFDALGNPDRRDVFGSFNQANDRAEGMAVSSTGRTWVVGSTQGSLASSPVGSTDIFIRQFDGSHNQEWTAQVGTQDIDAAIEVAQDGSDHIYVLALSYSDLSRPGTFENDGIPNAFLMRYSTSGEYRWTRRIGPANRLSLATGLAVDSEGNAYVAGWTTASLGTHVNQGGSDAFVVRFNRSGSQTRAWQWGTPEDDELRDVVVTNTGIALGWGTTHGSMEADNQGGQDVFVVQFATSP